MTMEEYRESMSEITSEEELAEDIEEMKHNEYEEAKRSYIDGEMSDEELEEEMDELFESGDDFVDSSTEEGSSIGVLSSFEWLINTVSTVVDAYMFPILCILSVAALVVITGGHLGTMATLLPAALLFAAVGYFVYVVIKL